MNWLDHGVARVQKAFAGCRSICGGGIGTTGGGPAYALALVPMEPMEPLSLLMLGVPKMMAGIVG